ncbi:PepSY-associated TM helix domain-containing protein [Ideonella sp. DXS29W]|uniref:PepSY-associated TM helix domain-containing protein n=1 Tax=Ideonella lacteola TaxID=2984193 RepID=A0ABU9BV74_9BURK
MGAHLSGHDAPLPMPPSQALSAAAPPLAGPLDPPPRSPTATPRRQAAARLNWRAWFTRLHRWFGLGTALFLFIAGLTGAIISWDHELDEWLNPHLFEARTAGTPLPVAELVARVEQAEPQVRITYHPLSVEPGHAFGVFVAPRINPATGTPFDVGFNQLAVDPVNGQVQGRRMWGAVSLDRENLLPFLYKLHYTMHLPEGGGIEWGIWLMGLVGIVWVFDTLIALSISFPNPRQWARSLAFRWRAGGHRLVFDLHRSGGVWLFALVLMLAITSVAMNLNTQVVRPVVSWFSTLTPSPFDTRAPAPAHAPVEPQVSSAEIVAKAQKEAIQRGWTAPAGAVFFSPEFGVWGVGFFEPGRDHGDGGLGNPWLYFDARTGEPAGAQVPGEGSAGDIFLQSMFPLHSGRILGLPGRILISVLGLVIAGFSATGVYLWWRKRVARAAVARATVGLAQTTASTTA